MMRFALVALACFTAASAVAGPLEGDLFGYKLGTKYPVTPQSRGAFWPVLGHWVIVADRAEKPKDLGQVELIATPKTYTIANIYAKTEFADEASAEALANKYADLLQTMYGDKCKPEEKYLKEVLKLRCSDYELSVHHFKPDKPTAKHSVHVGLTYVNGDGKWKAIQAQFKSEYEQLDKEGKQYRLDRARKDQSLKGLQ
jgi:hypothetical protein